MDIFYQSIDLLFFASIFSLGSQIYFILGSHILPAGLGRTEWQIAMVMERNINVEMRSQC